MQDLTQAINIINLKQRPEYLLPLATWHERQWADLNPGKTLDDRLAMMHVHLNDAFIPSTFIALQGTTLLGSAAIIQCDMETAMQFSPWLASVYVDMPYRNKGIGSLLVRHVMHEAKQAGFKHLYLFTPDKELFYQRLGWKRVSQLKYCHHDVSIMSVIVN